MATTTSTAPTIWYAESNLSPSRSQPNPTATTNLQLRRTEKSVAFDLAIATMFSHAPAVTTTAKTNSIGHCPGTCLAATSPETHRPAMESTI